MEEFRIDESRWPIVVVVFPPSPTVEQYRALFQEYVALTRRGERIAYLIDMRNFNPLAASASVRKAAAEIFAENRHHLIPATLCEARVAANVLTKGVLTAFDWLTGQKWPCANFTSVDEADRWIQRNLRAAGVATTTADV